ncbi:MAG: dihydropteroate synthase [Hyphomicrobiales bacterium]|nr:MAG: dihydropteroate synthase [Hyphomicrobiales bacterium]
MTAPILRPDGLIYGAAAQAAVSSGAGGWLAGGPAAFIRAELIEGAPGKARRRILTYQELTASREPALATRLAHLCAPRPPMAGLDWARTRIMGIVNVTPDSFSDGGLYQSAPAAIAHGHRLIADGADILDIGGESTRPGAAELDEDSEWARIGPVLEGLAGKDTPLSVDTRKSGVMTRAAVHGARMLNDVSALGFDDGALSAARASRLPVVLMHAKGSPETMQQAPHYEDVLVEVFHYLESRIALCEQAGLARGRLIVDPGIGFGKTLAHNLTLLSGLSAFHGLGCPVLLGASRKRFIGELSDEPEAARRVPGSLAAALQAARQGVQIVRVHDVRESRQALDVQEAILTAVSP